MKKLLILLSMVTASGAYSAVSTTLDVNATLIKPLTLESSAKELQGSITTAGGAVALSTVDLLVTGMLSADVNVIAPKDVTLYEVGGTQDIVLQSKFSSTATTTGTTLQTKLTLDASGEVTTTYNLEGTVKTGIKVGASNKAEFVGNTDITVAYN